MIAPYMSEASPRLRVATGDDAAVWKPDGDVVITTDSLVEDVHFHVWPDDDFYADLGWKLLAISLSDLAAMGARPGPAFLALALPRTFLVSHVQALYRGLRECAARYDALLAGGNFSDSATVVLTSTCLGTPAAANALTRAGARAGWKLAVTGELGGAAAALNRFHDGAEASQIPGSWLQRLRRPEPRVDAGIALADRALSAIDVSDGVFIDAARLLGSTRGLVIEAEALPIAEGIRDQWPDQWLDIAGGGEDYEVLFASPADRTDDAIDAVRAAGCAATVIGEFDEGDGVRAVVEGVERRMSGAGYQHFA